MKSAARSASDNSAFQIAARLGYAVNGLLHLLIGGIAISVALGRGGSADHSGALAGLAASPGGAITLWIVVVGLTGLGLWQVVEAILVPARDPAKKWAHRAKELGTAVVYLAVAATAFTFAIGGSSSSSGDTQSLTAKLLATPGGVFVVVAIGLVIIVIGAYFVFNGARKKFADDLSLPVGTAGSAITGLGVAGYVAKGIALGVVGILFVVAAITVDASASTGLDGAASALAALPFGMAILIAVGAGLVAFGLYSVARARYTRL